MNIFRRGDIQPGKTVAIMGIGFLAALLTRMATNVGARVLSVTRRP
jgi:D-arabinose 1-dehydrogenase-like Zn-dependent alcohol dehydrogenase